MAPEGQINSTFSKEEKTKGHNSVILKLKSLKLAEPHSVIPRHSILSTLNTFEDMALGDKHWMHRWTDGRRLETLISTAFVWV